MVASRLLAAVALSSPAATQVVHHLESSASFDGTPLVVDDWQSIPLELAPGTVHDAELRLEYEAWASIEACQTCSQDYDKLASGKFLFYSLGIIEGDLVGAAGLLSFDSRALAYGDCHTFTTNGFVLFADTATIPSSTFWKLSGVGPTNVLLSFHHARLADPDYNGGEAGPPVAWHSGRDGCNPDGVWFEAESDEWGMTPLTATLAIDFVPHPLPPWLQHVYCWSNPNSTGLRADLYAGGTADPTENALYFSVENVPQGFGYMIMSRNDGFVWEFGGGDGNLCLGGSIIRFNTSSDMIVTPNAQGHVAFKPDLSALPQQTTFLAGETWYFQLWFRDWNPAITHNTSNGLAVTFE